MALVAIPALITGLGQSRFGILTIGWALMGYFSVFDFGLSRATTKYLAQACHDGDEAAARGLFWTSAAAHLVLGLAGGLILFVCAAPLERMLSLEPALRAETRMALYLLALSVPLVVVTSVTRGMLEALHRFDLVNAVKVPASMLNYLGPLAALTFTQRLPPVIAVVLVGRAVVFVVYLVMCLKTLPAIRKLERPTLTRLRPLFALGGWLTVGTFVIPVLASIDRFAIGSVVSVAAVAVYTAPYEVVTRLWMFSASLLGVLFPRFAILGANSDALSRLYRLALVALAVCTVPAAAMVITFAPEFFDAWLGADLAEDGATVARWLTVGVAINVIAQVPYTTLQATGHADITAKLQMLQMPFYAVTAWLAAAQWGVRGVAIAWTLRAAADAALMFGAAGARLGHLHRPRAAMTGVLVAAASGTFMAWCWLGIPVFAPSLLPKVLLAAISIASFAHFLSRTLEVRWRQVAGLVRGGA